MKTLFILFGFIVMILQPKNSTEEMSKIRFEDLTLQQTFSKAKQEQKLVFVDFYAT